ncbi:MAG: hypothetical protein WEC84_03715 [Candidatus Andersenbacteria bacterium]
MSSRGDRLNIGAAPGAETVADAEVETSRLGKGKELELARAVVAGDGETAGEICLKEYLRSLADGEQHSDIVRLMR